mgnify:FL=1
MTQPCFLPLDPGKYGITDTLSRDILLINRILGETLSRQESEALLRVARELFQGDLPRKPSDLLAAAPELRDPVFCRKALRAYTILFQLLNKAEQKEVVAVNRQREIATDGRRPESIADAVLAMKEQGLSADDVRQVLGRLDIVPTLTAHPTEARRRAVQDKLHRASLALGQYGAPVDSPDMEGPLSSLNLREEELVQLLTLLWQTDELRETPLTVDDEVRNVLYFFENTIFQVVPWLHRDFSRALHAAYPGENFEIPVFMRYRSWVGGDRDGNPNVTPDVTWRALIEHKKLALDLYIKAVQDLRQVFSQSRKLSPPTDELVESIREDQGFVPVSIDQVRRYQGEPYSLKFLLIEQRLQASRRKLDDLVDFHAEGQGFVSIPPAYSSSAQFLQDLQIIRNSLKSGGSNLLAETGMLADLVIQVRTFGFHLASLDIRQHSEEHEKALDEILLAAGITSPEQPYSSLSEEMRIKLLTKELASPRPLVPRDFHGSGRAMGLLEVFEVIRHARRYLSENSVCSYIISMTHGASDILEVLILAREAGLVRVSRQNGELRIESDLDVIPLFETIDDLNHCDSLMKRLFANPAYRAHLKSRNDFQEIMLGYSDSSKDGGYLAANWALHDTQSRLGRLCERSGVSLRLFHGRGGTIGRGGGRANAAILSQPRQNFNGRIRFTEQGEVISFRYSLKPIAHRHFEQIANAVVIATAFKPGRKRSRETWRKDMRLLADQSRKVYRNLVYEHPDFWEFFTRATPIGFISRLPIASRPVFRPQGGTVGLEGLRAIPWVFAWVQSRYVIPGWFGLGSALDWFSREDPAHVEELKAMYRDWPFFRTVVNNAQLELNRAHMPTASRYAERSAAGGRIHEIIQKEFTLTRDWILKITGQQVLLENAVVLQRMVEFRNPLVAPLSSLQVAMMDIWENESAEMPEDISRMWQESILMSITGIAAAMQSTG